MVKIEKDTNFKIVTTIICFVGFIIFYFLLFSKASYMSLRYVPLSYTLNESRIKFKNIGKDIEIIADKYKHEVSCDEFDVSDKLVKVDYYININEDEYIFIGLENSIEERPICEKGKEKVWISHDIRVTDSYNEGKFDIKLYEEIINRYALRPISNKFLKKFITADEEEYPTMRDPSQKIAKEYKFDFWGHTSIYYSLGQSITDVCEDDFETITYSSFLK